MSARFPPRPKGPTTLPTSTAILSAHPAAAQDPAASSSAVRPAPPSAGADSTLHSRGGAPFALQGGVAPSSSLGLSIAAMDLSVPPPVIEVDDLSSPTPTPATPDSPPSSSSCGRANSTASTSSATSSNRAKRQRGELDKGYDGETLQDKVRAHFNLDVPGRHAGPRDYLSGASALLSLGLAARAPLMMRAHRPLGRARRAPPSPLAPLERQHGPPLARHLERVRLGRRGRPGARRRRRLLPRRRQRRRRQQRRTPAPHRRLDAVAPAPARLHPLALGVRLVGHVPLDGALGPARAADAPQPVQALLPAAVRQRRLGGFPHLHHRLGPLVAPRRGREALRPRPERGSAPPAVGHGRGARQEAHRARHQGHPVLCAAVRVRRRRADGRDQGWVPPQGVQGRVPQEGRKGALGRAQGVPRLDPARPLPVVRQLVRPSPSFSSARSSAWLTRRSMSAASRARSAPSPSGSPSTGASSSRSFILARRA